MDDQFKAIETNDSDDDDIVLSSDTRNILNEFLQEKEAKVKLESSGNYNVDSVDFLFEENWQLSQFWYDKATRETLAKVCQQLIAEGINKNLEDKSNFKIGLLSCPSLYPNIKNIQPNATIRLFEHDKRFNVFKNDFVYYDFNDGLSTEYLMEYNDSFNIIIMDPPFLSEECVEKMLSISKKLSKPNCKIIVCSGQTISIWIEKFSSLHVCDFKPAHQNCLGNEFTSYANFDLDKYIYK